MRASAETGLSSMVEEDAERVHYTPHNIYPVMLKHYGDGYGGAPVQGPLTEAQTIIEDGIIFSRSEYGTEDDSFTSEYVRGLVLESLSAWGRGR